MSVTTKEHWEKIYRKKQPHEFSWWQDNPTTSLSFTHSLGIPRTAQIIDIGGGDSKFVDCLLDEGYENITVLDISEQAIARAKARLGIRAHSVRWVVSDVNEFRPDRIYDVWHDRATFHFLTEEALIGRYISLVQRSVKPGGCLILGTFSSSGPKTCSGLPVQQYDEQSLYALLQKGFDKIQCMTEDHMTPFNTKQNFLFCSLRRHLS
jgi:2-polyprenyl-3-methyl-5-hydroxy-6-metoxy-1,4-benzoquinol methylase